MKETKKGSFSVHIDTHACKGCRLCITCCPAHHLRMSEALNIKGSPYAEPLPEKGSCCIGCGRCYLMCPESCIEISTHTSTED